MTFQIMDREMYFCGEAAAQSESKDHITCHGLTAYAHSDPSPKLLTSHMRTFKSPKLLLVESFTPIDD
jgi:hypothetical protein